MQQQRMGVVVIGQSPRPSVVDEIAAALSPGLEIDLRGALDGMTRAEIDAIPPSDGHDALFTLLPNGDSVTISKKAVEARAAIQIEKFAREGVRVTMLACTGKWERPNVVVVGVTMRPGSDAEAVDEAARKMSALSPDLVVMDCMSYTRANKKRVRLTYGGPIILAIAAAASTVEELVA